MAQMKAYTNPDEDLDLNLRSGTPLQKSFEKVDVPTVPPSVHWPNIFLASGGPDY